MTTQVNNRTQRQSTYETQVDQQQAPNRTAGNTGVGGGSHSVDPPPLPRMYNTSTQTEEGSGQRGTTGNAQGMPHSRQTRAAESPDPEGASYSQANGGDGIGVYSLPQWQKDPAYTGPKSAAPQGYEKQNYSVQPDQNGDDQYTPVGEPSKSTTSAPGGFAFHGFTEGQEALLKQDIDKARANSADAWSRINQGPDQKFDQAFGKAAENEPQTVAEVKRTVGNIDYAVHNEHFDMRPSSEYEGDASQKNAMFSDDGRNIYVKPQYFDKTTTSQEHDGQIVRTLSHMPQVGGTADYTQHPREAGRRFIEQVPQLAPHNSDSYRSYITPREKDGTRLAQELGEAPQPGVSNF